MCLAAELYPVVSSPSYNFGLVMAGKKSNKGLEEYKHYAKFRIHLVFPLKLTLL